MDTSVKRVLVGTDGSAAASRGVAWAASLAGALGAELIVATVATQALSQPTGAVADESDEHVARSLDGPWSAAARDRGASVTTLLLHGDPRAALLEAVSTHDVDLMVLGSAGTGWFPALHLGHVAHALAHHCTVPLVVVPPGATTEVPRRMLVGLDGSSGSAAAVGWTTDLAQALGSEVFAVHVHMRERRDRAARQHAQLEQHCQQWAAPLRTAGVATHVVIAQGWPASAIVELEAIEAPGLVVLGARGTGGFDDLRLGSVALGVLQHSIVPVAIVPGELPSISTQGARA